ncbi:MAG: PIN domain-containing protein [bacterium]|nr:PIN domain-containing protein [bacterium]
MKGVMVDTSGWKAVYDASDEFHTQASDTWMELKRRKVSLYTTDYILDEALTLLRITVGHRLAVQFGRDVRGSRIINIIDLDREIKEEAWKIFVRYQDKRFSSDLVLSYLE